MSIRWMALVWDVGPNDRAERFVLLALADFANDEGECWPSVDGIARKTCMTERGCQKIIRRLEETGWLEIDTGLGRRNCNLYKLKNPEPRSPRTPFTPNASAEKGERERKNPEPRSPEPSITIKEPSEEERATEILSRVLSPEAVRDYVAHRRAKRAKLTARAAELIAKDLLQCEDPDAAVFRSIKNGWTGVFPSKEKTHERTSKSTDKLRAFIGGAD